MTVSEQTYRLELPPANDTYYGDEDWRARDQKIGGITERSL